MRPWLPAQLVVADLRITSAAVIQACQHRETFSNLSLLDPVPASVRMTLMPTPKTSSQSTEIQVAHLSSFGA
jgi:hypothetical protein